MHRAAGAGPLQAASASSSITIRIEEAESKARWAGIGKSASMELVTDCHGAMISQEEKDRQESCPRDPLQVSFAGRSLRALPTLPSNPLHTLTLTSNELSDLPPSLPATLLHLDISRNWFRKIPDSLPANLVTLLATHNLLRNSGVTTLPTRLKSIDLRFNQNLNKRTYLEGLKAKHPNTSILLTVTHPPPPDLYVGESAAERDPSLLRSQLEPWPTSALRRRIVSDFHGPFLCESTTTRADVMKKLLELYESEGGERRVLKSSGVELDSEFLRRARVIMEEWSNSFDNGNEERTSVNAQHYMILTSPRLYELGSRKAARATAKVNKYRKIWDVGMDLLGSVDGAFARNISAIAVTHNFQGSPHIDKQNTGPFYACSFGDFDAGTGGVSVELSARIIGRVETKDRLGKVDGRFPHWVSPYKGERWSLVFYRTDGVGEEIGNAIFNLDDDQ